MILAITGTILLLFACHDYYKGDVDRFYKTLILANIHIVGFYVITEFTK